MRFPFLVSLSVILALGLGLLISGASLADRDDDSRQARAENLVVGFFGCGDFLHGGAEPRRETNASWAFTGWVGVGKAGDDPQTEPFFLNLEPEGELGENCLGMTQEIRSVARALGCATGAIQVTEQSEGADAALHRGFGFTCSGRREHVVGAMAEISRAILEFPI